MEHERENLIPGFKGEVPHTSIDTDAHWTKSGWHGWIYDWKLHIVVTAACNAWLPLAAEVTPANGADNQQAPAMIEVLPGNSFWFAPGSPETGEIDPTRIIAGKNSASSLSESNVGQRNW